MGTEKQMSVAIIGCLAVALLYLGKRYGDSNAENVQLRSQVASLKRQLSRKQAW
jgi:hypothetical protein